MSQSIHCSVEVGRGSYGYLCKALYLSNVFIHLNELNLELQGQETDIFRVQEKVWVDDK